MEDRIKEDGWPGVEKSPVKVLAPAPEFTIPDLARKTPHRFEMTSDQFRQVMAPFLAPPGPEPHERSLLGPVMETLERAGLSPDRLDAVVLHGGSSLNPYVGHLMRTTFRGQTLFDRAQIVATPDPLVSVARGAALFSYWRHARAVEIIRPIMAEDLGIIVRSGEPMPLVAGGYAAALPRRRLRARRHRRSASSPCPATPSPRCWCPSTREQSAPRAWPGPSVCPSRRTRPRARRCASSCAWTATRPRTGGSRWARRPPRPRLP